MEKKKVPPRYDAAFKEGAVKLVTESGRQPKEVADELGISVTSLRDWLKLSGVSPKEAGRSNKDAKRIRELEAQLREARKRESEKDDIIAVLKKSVGILSKPQNVSNEFVKTDTSGLSKDKLCQLLNISRSAYYAWLVRPPSKRSLKGKAILRELVRLHTKYPTFGLDPLHQLVKPLFGASRKRIHRLKKQAHIRSIRHKAYKVTTNSNHNNAVSPNLLGRKFKAVRPNQAHPAARPAPKVREGMGF